MLINLTIANFLSFDTPVSFSMEAGRKTSRHENHVRDVNGVSVLRGAAIYGANASGKSNLLKAMDVFQQMVYGGDCSIVRGMQFMLGESVKPDILFDVVYSWDKVIFRYELVTDGVSVKSEKLSLVNGDNQAMLFNRVNGTSLELDKNLESAEWYRQRTVANNLLYLSKLMSDGIKEYHDQIAASEVVIAAYTGLIGMFVVGSDSFPRPGAFYEMVQRDEFKAFLLDILKKADLGVTGLSWIPLARKEAEMIFQMNPAKEFGTRVVRFNRGFYLIRNDESGVSGEEFSLEHNGVPLRAESESFGTIRLIGLAPVLYQLLHGKGVWFVDEADCHMHPMLLHFMLKGFMDRENAESQLIVTLHDTNLMTHDIWRADEIWFAEKRVDGSSDLYSLYQFQPRHDKNLEKGYLQGLYGALPSLGGEMVYGE